MLLNHLIHPLPIGATIIDYLIIPFHLNRQSNAFDGTCNLDLCFGTLSLRHVGHSRDGDFGLSCLIFPKTTNSVRTRKIRLTYKWYLPFERVRGEDELGDYLTVNGLAKRLDVNERRIYDFIYRRMIPPESITHEPQAGIYLIQNDEQLIDALRKHVEKQKKRNRKAKPADPSVKEMS
jgi:hypothetical protein